METSARDRALNALSNTEQPAKAPEPETTDTQEPEIISTSPSRKAALPELSAPISTASKPKSPKIDTPKTESSKVDSPKPTPQKTAVPKTKQAHNLGFFTSAKDYLAQRGVEPQPRLTLRYDVRRKNAKTAAIGPKSIVDIILGTDYAAISKSSDEIVIYDFKEKRLLNLSVDENTFTNASLYAAAYRSLDTVGRMTDGGQRRTLPLGEDLTLDAFYLESALGYAAGPTPKDLAVTQNDGKITADFEGERVFTAILSGPVLKNVGQAYSFIGLLYHSEPVHPAILAELKDVGTAPSSMTFQSFGPKVPEGEIISWTLKSKMSETAAFPLPANAKSAVELESVSPLGFVMSEAVAGRALGGRPNPKSVLTKINEQIADGDPVSAWVSAQSLKDMVGGCDRVSGLCKAISTAEEKKSGNTELASLINALTQMQNKSSALKGLAALEPIINAPNAPSLVLRSAGLTLAKTTPSQREAAGMSEIDPADLLTQAIALNPYDLLAYQGLAQLSAARGDFIQSWDINDALRALSPVSATLRAPIDKAEAQLEITAPGFFPPTSP